MAAARGGGATAGGGGGGGAGSRADAGAHTAARTVGGVPAVTRAPGHLSCLVCCPGRPLSPRERGKDDHPAAAANAGEHPPSRCHPPPRLPRHPPPSYTRPFPPSANHRRHTVAGERRGGGTAAIQRRVSACRPPCRGCLSSSDRGGYVCRLFRSRESVCRPPPKKRRRGGGVPGGGEESGRGGETHRRGDAGVEMGAFLRRWASCGWATQRAGRRATRAGRAGRPAMPRGPPPQRELDGASTHPPANTPLHWAFLSCGASMIRSSDPPLSFWIAGIQGR